MALFPGPKDSVFWFAFESLTDGNLWKDDGPFGLHAQPQAGFVGPNFGLARNAKGKGYATFTGAGNSYATLPLRFYDVAPTGLHTYVFAYRNTSTSYETLFSSMNAATTAGTWLTAFLNPGVNEFIASYITPGGVLSNARQTTLGWNGPTVVCLTTIEPVPKAYRDGTSFVTAWNVGAYGATVYDAALVPWIGRTQNGAGFPFTGTMSFLALFKDWIPTDVEAKAMSSWLRDQV